MSLLRRILGLETRAGFSDLERIIASASGTAAGLSVTPEGALRCPIVLACVSALSGAVGQMPLILYRRGPGGEKTRATDHPLYRLLHDAPNAWTGSTEFRVSMMTAALLHGDAFAFIGRARGQVLEIVQAPAGAVQVDADDWTGEPVYTVTRRDGTQQTVPREDIFRLRVPGPDPVRGLSLTVQARESIALALQLEAYAARVFARGARPSGVLEVPGKLSEPAVNRLRASLSQNHANAANAGTMVLEEGAKFSQQQFSSVDLQFIELFRHQIAQIARAYRVPLHMIQELERTTHSTAEHVQQQFLSTVLLPWLKLWEQSIARDLFTEQERDELFVEFMVDDLVKADLAARMQAFATAVTNGILNPNECRAMDNREPYDGGDVFMRPLNTGEAGGAADDD